MTSELADMPDPEPAPRRLLGDLLSSVGELAWRFQYAHAALGVRAQNPEEMHTSHAEPSQTAEYWAACFGDLAESHAPHLSRLRHTHRRAVDKIRACDATLARLAPVEQRLLELAFTPYGRATPALTEVFAAGSLWFAPVKPVHLLGVAIGSGAVARARHGDLLLTPDPSALLAWLEKERRNERLISRLREDALRTVTLAVELYDEVRLERVAVEREERAAAKVRQEQVFQEQLAALRARVAGKAISLRRLLGLEPEARDALR